MPIVKLAFKIDVLKMEQAFQMGYRQGEKALFPTQIDKVKRFLSQVLNVCEVLYGRKRMIDLRSSCKGTQISGRCLEKKSMSRMGTIDFRLGYCI